MEPRPEIQDLVWDGEARPERYESYLATRSSFFTPQAWIQHDDPAFFLDREPALRPEPGVHRKEDSSLFLGKAEQLGVGKTRRSLLLCCVRMSTSWARNSVYQRPRDLSIG
jgi:hypothetical protein